ncbi:MAG: FkbM methyltransferase [Solivirus sp.]|uniref:FkbM methyltransferase n=1 Tax=Solivirus sp. TaxID=2487772 RepID=A0A3G5AFA1_9VIRU|nr:MAG: FkbM methyltransferase [Solivirus sp.]
MSVQWWSQFGEDSILAGLFPNNYIGVCVDVGSSDGISGNNTLHFERRGWRVLNIEPNPKLFAECEKIRKRSINCAVGAENKDSIPFTIFILKGGNESAISGLEPDIRLIESHAHLIESEQVIKVPIRTLSSILDEESFPTEIDFISIDTENTELDVLKGLDLNKYKVKYFVIEDNFNEGKCGEYLKQFGYEHFYRLAVNNFYKIKDFGFE